MEHLEKEILINGYEIAFVARISESKSPRDIHKIYANLRELHNCTKNLPFNEEMVIKIKYDPQENEKNPYEAVVYTKNNNF